jgi:predicted flap endonuclease-1-like 5' DNA nuclease
MRSSDVLTSVERTAADDEVIEGFDGEPDRAHGPGDSASMLAGPITDTDRSHSDPMMARSSAASSNASHAAQIERIMRKLNRTSDQAGKADEAPAKRAAKPKAKPAAKAAASTKPVQQALTDGCETAGEKFSQGRVCCKPAAAKAPAPKAASPKAASPNQLPQPKAIQPKVSGKAAAAKTDAAKRPASKPAVNPARQRPAGRRRSVAKTPVHGLTPKQSSQRAPAGPRVAARRLSSTKKPVRTSNWLARPRGGKADDLLLIRGIGPVNKRKLNEHGIFHFDQIAAWTRADIAAAEAYLEFDGRIDREDWIGQAAALAASGRKAGLSHGASRNQRRRNLLRQYPRAWRR